MGNGFDFASLFSAAGSVANVVAPGAVPYLVVQTPVGTMVVNLSNALASATGQGQSSIFGVPVTYGLGYGVPPVQTLPTNLMLIAAAGIGAWMLLT